MTVSAEYVLWGSAGHAKVLEELISAHGGRVIALFDNLEVPSALIGVPVYYGRAGFEGWAAQQRHIDRLSAAVAIGGHRGRDRIEIHALFRRHGLGLPPLIHPDASFSRTASIGAGSQVLAHALVAAEVRIGEACIINHKASVDHESTLGNGVHVAPGAILCGCVSVGDNVLIGAGAVVLPRITVGANAVVGAGAVVTRNVAAGSTVAGNPARPALNRQ